MELPETELTTTKRPVKLTGNCVSIPILILCRFSEHKTESVICSASKPFWTANRKDLILQ